MHLKAAKEYQESLDEVTQEKLGETLSLFETQEQADAYRLEVQKLKEQMGVALDSVSNSRLSSKFGLLQDDIQFSPYGVTSFSLQDESYTHHTH